MHLQSLLAAAPRHHAMPAGWIVSTDGPIARLSFGGRLARLQRSWLLPFLIGVAGGAYIWLPDALAGI
jgi:hypothetical protein